MVRTLLAVSLLATPTVAFSRYVAVPAVIPGQDRVIVKDVAWKCVDGACEARESHSRADIVCASLARKLGRLQSFSEKGQFFDAARLEKCNMRAR